MHTYDLMTDHGVAVPEHLEADAEIPVICGLQVQGDIAIVPTRPGRDAGRPVPPNGVPVVRGEAGGNTHLLVAAGAVSWRPSSDVELGTVTVEDGAVGYLLHPEHGANGLAPGTYRLRRQREQADQIRTVAD